MKKCSISFWIFIVLLILFLGIVIYNYWNISNVNEGFITFQEDKMPLDRVVVPTYSPNVRILKLYDNIFFDNINGNIVQANGIEFSQDNSGGTVSSIIDTSGKSISSIVVNKRDGSVNPVIIETKIENGVVVNTPSRESKMADYSSKFSEWMVSVGSPTKDTKKYQILYVAWDLLTFIDIIDYSNRTSPISQLAAFFQQSGDVSVSNRYGTNNYVIDISPTNNYSLDPQDGRMVVQSLYTKDPVYQICSFLQYDTKYGHLIFVANSGASSVIEVYDRNNNLVVDMKDANGIQKVPYSCFTVPFDSINSGKPQYFVYFVVQDKKTLVIVLQAVSNSADPFKIVKVARFDENGYVEPKEKTVSPSFTDNKLVDSNIKGTNLDESTDLLELYQLLKLYELDLNVNNLFYNDSVIAKEIDYIEDNYAKKTELVPPVYPVVLSCPTCGEGGRVSTDFSGNAVKVEGSGKTNLGGTVQGVTGSVVGGVEKIAGGAYDLTKNVVGETAGLAKETVGGAVGLGKETVGGAVGLAKETVGGAVGLAKETVGGAVGLVKDTASGTADFLKSAGTSAVNELNYLTSTRGTAATGGTAAGYGTATPYGQSYGSQTGGLPIGGPTSQYPIQYKNGAAVQGVDAYSRYGAMPNKGGDFLPLTASFSAFGK